MPWPASVGLLLVRVVVGAAFIMHGLPKIVHASTWMGTRPLSWPWGGAIGAVPPWLQATVAAVEFFGGFALLFGVLARLAGVFLFADMLVAFLFAELPRHAPFVGAGHDLEPNLTYLAVSFLVAVAGAGTISIDAAVLAAPRRKRVRRRNVPFAA